MLQKLSTDESVLPVVGILISVSDDLDVWHPVWGSAHDGGDGFNGCLLWAFDDQLIMDVADDPERFKTQRKTLQTSISA